MSFLTVKYFICTDDEFAINSKNLHIINSLVINLYISYGVCCLLTYGHAGKLKIYPSCMLLLQMGIPTLKKCQDLLREESSSRRIVFQ